jgi:cation diffusion facilitator CzcD-associated flavoprotein CzcO
LEASTVTSEGPRSLRVVVIGAGLSGILAAIRLREQGYHDVTLYEKAARLGGTWRDNAYPGVACDIPSHFYSYSFAPNPEWTRQYSPGGEILRYLEDVARRYEVDALIRFSEEVTEAKYESGRWQLTTSRDRHDVADVVIAATGVTHHPSIPELPGLATFAGAAFHSARWDQDVPLDGRRIGVVGTGSSSVQIVSALVTRAHTLSLFQRTAQWIMPQENKTFTEEDKQNFRRDAEVMRKMRAGIARRFVERFADAVVDKNSPQLKVIEETCRNHLETEVTDPALRARLRPDYRAACKRLVISPDFYRAIQHPNARLVTEGIDVIEPAGVRTRDGQLHELDVLVLATGFRTDRFLRPMRVLGEGGRSLDDVWAARPRAYMTVAIPGFPNLFMLNGPSGPVGNFPLIEVAELQMGYILQLLARLRDGHCRAFSASEAATEAYEAARIEAAKNTVWTTGCNSWYLDGDGVPAVWPWTIARFYEQLSAPDLTAFERS